MNKRKRGDSEKVREFLAEVKLLATKAYTTISADVRNHVILQGSIEGISNYKVLLELRKSRPATIQDALEQAVHLEAVC